jgi:hypothetical protein
VQRKLAQDRAAAMAWEPIPLSVYGESLPAFIRSSWVFVLRAWATTGAERHPNSHQRMMSFRGIGDLQTGDDGHWQSNLLISNREAVVGAEVGYDTTKRLASSNCRGFRLGGCLVPDRVGRRVDRRTTGYHRCESDPAPEVCRPKQIARGQSAIRTKVFQHAQTGIPAGGRLHHGSLQGKSSRRRVGRRPSPAGGSAGHRALDQPF